MSCNQSSLSSLLQWALGFGSVEAHRPLIQAIRRQVMGNMLRAAVGVEMWHILPVL